MCPLESKHLRSFCKHSLRFVDNRTTTMAHPTKKDNTRMEWQGWRPGKIFSFLALTQLHLSRSTQAQVNPSRPNFQSARARALENVHSCDAVTVCTAATATTPPGPLIIFGFQLYSIPLLLQKFYGSTTRPVKHSPRRVIEKKLIK